MRTLSFLFLVFLVAVLAVLAIENNHPSTVAAWKWQWELPFPLLAVGIYVLGMLSGWALLGVVKRSWHRVTEPDRA